MKITVEQEISEEAIDNVLCCALDPGYGGAYYWCTAKRHPSNPNKDAQYLHEVLFGGDQNQPGTIIITIAGDNDDPDNGKTYNIDRWSVESALQKMADDKDGPGRRVLANIIADNTDADDGDLLIQFCLFGKSVYG
jgi:hypothetical protein